MVQKAGFKSFCKSSILFIISISTCCTEAKATTKESIYDFEWMDQDKKIYVLQNRLFIKDQKWSISALLHKNTSYKFVNNYYGTIKVGKYLAEDWAIEGSFATGTRSENDTASLVNEQGAVPYSRSISSYMGAHLLWSPLYGKFNAFDKILYLDWFFALGPSFLSTEDNRNKFGSSRDESLTKESHVGAHWLTGFHFYLNERFALRFEFQGIHYQADTFGDNDTNQVGNYQKKTFYHHYDWGLGLTGFF